ncbi:hypothetical protein ABIB27_001982 [Arthrobacter sp. UYEF21]
MSAIQALSEAASPGSLPSVSAEGSNAPPTWPVHCSTEMEITTPAVGAAAVGSTFEPQDHPVLLPPVWRCSCGFQLDAWVSGQTDMSEEPTAWGEPFPALSGALHA